MKHKESNMKQTHQTWIIAGTLLLTLLFSIAETMAQSQSDTQEAREQLIKWWCEARFGMFIHWGLYAIPGGTWKDKVYNEGYSEWIMFDEKIPAREYEKLAGKFEVLGLQSKVTKAYLLAGRKELKVKQTAGRVTISLPAGAPDKIASVICLEIADQVAKITALSGEPEPVKSARWDAYDYKELYQYQERFSENFPLLYPAK